MIISLNRLLSRGLAAICEERREFRLRASVTTVAQAEDACARSRAVVLVVDLGCGDRLRRRDLLREALGGLGSRLPVVLLFGQDGANTGEDSADMLHGVRCALAVEDAPEDFVLALSAAIRGACHFSPSVAQRAKLISGSPNRKEESHEKALSPREKEVVDMTRAGLMPGEIARRLGRSVKTVEAHFQRVKTKLGLRCIAELRAQGHTQAVR